ncbi:MAG: hypothetical protein ACKO9T_01295, partial [Nitrospira sp.]
IVKPTRLAGIIRRLIDHPRRRAQGSGQAMKILFSDESGDQSLDTSDSQSLAFVLGRGITDAGNKDSASSFW